MKYLFLLLLCNVSLAEFTNAQIVLMSESTNTAIKYKSNKINENKTCFIKVDDTLVNISAIETVYPFERCTKVQQGWISGTCLETTLLTKIVTSNSSFETKKSLTEVEILIRNCK